MAVPPLRRLLPTVAMPSLKITVPLGEPLVLGTIVAVNVTEPPYVAGLPDEESVVTVLAALTVIDDEVFAVIAPLVISVAVSVEPPASLSVTEKFFVPPTRAALDGSVAFTSLDVIRTVSVELTAFQFESTALTVTDSGAPTVCAVGAPVLPVTVPGAAVSPGTSI